ncbi:MAG TPA: glycoside hydrolase family 36 N-terminal domain-containing protein, partial [Jatrophihabitans sp.]|nr:glycoside hydrolase family 36 N-terminal domain-containing protein [Jatrophihabitans sp.]
MTEFALPAGLPVTDGSAEPGTGLVLFRVPGALSRIGWCGPRQPGLDPAGVRQAVGELGTAASVHHSGGRALPVLPGPADHWPGQPGLRGFRLAEPAAGGPAAGRDWSPAFVERDALVAERRIELRADDPARGLALRTELESVPGGAIRVRHTVTNQAAGEYVLQGLDVLLPVPDRVAEILDLTGRWGRERAPQRHPVRDGIWLREARTGRPGPESATLLSVGTAGFGFGHGEVWGVHLAWSGNGRYFLQRLESGQTVLGAGELLLPGELTLADGESYATPWVFLVASAHGLDGLAEQLHGYARS